MSSNPAPAEPGVPPVGAWRAGTSTASMVMVALRGSISTGSERQGDGPSSLVKGAPQAGQADDPKLTDPQLGQVLKRWRRIRQPSQPATPARRGSNSRVRVNPPKRLSRRRPAGLGRSSSKPSSSQGQGMGRFISAGSGDRFQTSVPTPPLPQCPAMPREGWPQARPQRPEHRSTPEPGPAQQHRPAPRRRWQCRRGSGRRGGSARGG